MKYYNFDTMFRSLRDALVSYLKENEIYYELSGSLADWHFEILTDAMGAYKINQYLDELCIAEA